MMPAPVLTLAWLALAVPAVYAAGAVTRPRASFDPAAYAARTAAFLGLLTAGGWWVTARGTPVTLPGTVVLDGPACTMLVLVTSLAAAILNFSRTYLSGDPGFARFARWMLVTLASVTTLVLSGHLLVIASAWLLTGACLYRLLTFYPDRPRALVAAHKQFLVGRLGDLLIFAAFLGAGFLVGTFRIDRVGAAFATSPGLADALASLLVLGVCLKTAQVPAHGWLTQVMEAPTPVSALLHAGVVNLGGYVLIRLSPWLETAHTARTVLVAVGTATAVTGALVSVTRPTVKESLAWSTIAQMGFMLVECGLGAWHLALLHIVAHSAYKGHAFLGSGSAVEAWTTRALSPRAPGAGLARWALASAAAFLWVGLAGALWGFDPLRDPTLWAFGTILAVALTPLLVRAAAGGFGAGPALGLAGAATLVLFAWHDLLGRSEPAAATAPEPLARAGIVAIGFAALLVAQALLAAQPRGAIARALAGSLSSGLWLDDTFSRLAFRVWPPPPGAPAAIPALRLLDGREAP